MGKGILIARILLGLPLLVFGLNQWFVWFEPPSDFQPAAQSWLEAIDATGYVQPMKVVVEVFCGACLVLGLWVPFALVLFAPILVHIVGYHMYLDPRMQSLVITAVVCALFLFLVLAYSRSWQGVLQVINRHHWSRRD